MHRVRIVIADRRPIVLQGFASLLGTQPDFEMVACCLDGSSCLAAIRSLMPDVVLLEDGFTDVTASDILAVADNEGLSSRLVFFTASVACGDLARALATGACGAISMNAKPEALVQSLRLEKLGADLARVGNEANGAASFGNDVLAVLTVNERTIMDLVADGLSDSQIARVLGVSLEIVRIHIDHTRQKLRTNSRADLAALAMSRRYGAMSILAAAILAALDDSPGHAATESFTVTAADGSAEVVTINIGRKERGTPARGASKDRDGAATGASSPTGNAVDLAAELAASSVAQVLLNAPVLGSSSYSTFMIAAFVALIYELDGANHAVQAFDFVDHIATLSTESDANGLAYAPSLFANFGGMAVNDGAFAFEFGRGDTIATDGSELNVVNVRAGDSDSDQGSTILRGSVNVGAPAANEASQRHPTQTGEDSESDQDGSQSDLGASGTNSGAAKHVDAGDGSNQGQSQKALVESDNGTGADQGLAKHADAGDGLNHGQSQKALGESGNGTGADQGLAKHADAGDGLNHGQLQKALGESGNGAAADQGLAKHTDAGDGLNPGQAQKALGESDNGAGADQGLAKHEVADDGLNPGQSQKALNAPDNGAGAGKQSAQNAQAGDLDSGKPLQDTARAAVDAANKEQSASKIDVAGSSGPSSGSADKTKSAVGTELGDSFHFKNGTDSTSSDMYDVQQVSQGNGKADGDRHHAVAGVSPDPAQIADGIDIAGAHHDSSGHANLHAVHDLFV